MQVFIHSGHLSLDNGAVGPLSYFFNLARMLKVEPTVGNYYGDDSLEVSANDWPIVEELLKDNAMLYKVAGTHQAWQNVQTDNVRHRLQFRDH